MPEDLLFCYHRGCGKEYKEEDNKPDSCTYHPGVPVFHDAYKSWSCCKRRCTDFTEFLNMKGCQISYHSNEKPPEPEKPPVDESKKSEIVEVKPPPRLTRPPFDSPLVTIKPSIASSLAEQVKQLVIKKQCSVNEENGEIPVGTSCKNKGCKASYPGPGVELSPCQHHPGVPVFHEGMKYWSCCTKRTTEFSVFLDQAGCAMGDHKWTEDTDVKSKPVCRHDWHQTGSDVIISIYAKKYDPVASSVKLNPIRAQIYLIFPEDGTSFNMDLELRGVIDVAKSSVQMLGSKVEIKMKKAELGHWSDLAFPRVGPEKPAAKVDVDVAVYDDDPVDLSDIN